MRMNALLPRLIWNIFGAAALFGNAKGDDDIPAQLPAATVLSSPAVQTDALAQKSM